MVPRLCPLLPLVVGAGIARTITTAAGREIPLPRFEPVVDHLGPTCAPGHGPGAAYVSGVDSRGRPVVPADLERTEGLPGALPGWVTIPVRVRGGPAREVEVEVPLPLPAR